MNESINSHEILNRYSIRVYKTEQAISVQIFKRYKGRNVLCVFLLFISKQIIPTPAVFPIGLCEGLVL